MTGGGLFDQEGLRSGVANTEAEKDECFALRYRVYVEDFGCSIPSADHRRRIDRTEDDDSATQIYVRRGDHVIGTMRVHHGAASALPHAFREACELEQFLADTPLEQMMSIGRLAIEKHERGGAAIVPLFQECLRWTRRDHPDTRLAFILAIEEPRLIALYRLLRFEPIHPDKRIRVDVGVCVPMFTRLGPRDGRQA